MDLNKYTPGFEEDTHLRSTFMRELILDSLANRTTVRAKQPTISRGIPKILIRYWHDPNDIPPDVMVCLESWDRLRHAGFKTHTFNDATALDYIQEKYGARQLSAFARCRHPAMRCDYFRLCFIVAEGGLYVDADDVLIDDGWRPLFKDETLKLQPLCYDVESRMMAPAAEIWQRDSPTEGRIFYVNNDPLAAPADHPVLRCALERATDKLLGNDLNPEIQSTTGPGNLTAALVAHARALIASCEPLDFEILSNWGAMAETRWDLSYRNDARNWRNMDSLAALI